MALGRAFHIEQQLGVSLLLLARTDPSSSGHEPQVGRAIKTTAELCHIPMAN
jgi:hypothetical protein